MPRRRAGHTTAVTLGGERFYITANAREDSTLGEVFIQWGKQGSSSAGLLDIYAIGWSVALQHGVPLTDLIRCNLDLYFVPNGGTDDPDIPRARSIADYTARRLAIDWLPAAERAKLGIRTIQERVDAASEWITQTETHGRAAVGLARVADGQAPPHRAHSLALTTHGAVHTGGLQRHTEHSPP